jgi:hypothetical protein
VAGPRRIRKRYLGRKLRLAHGEPFWRMLEKYFDQRTGGMRRESKIED